MEKIMMDGEPDSLTTVKEQLANFESVIQSYLGKQGVHKVPFNEDAEKVLNLRQFELKAQTSEECGEMSFVLAQYALYIQQEMNAHIARVNWVTANIKQVVAERAHEFDRYVKYEEKEQIIIATDERAGKLNEILGYARALSDRLAYMASRIQAVSNSLLELQRSKRRSDNVS